MLGAGLYAEIVGASFGLKGKQAVAALPAGSRIVTHTTERFRTQPETALNTAPEFDRYVPAVYFTEHQSDIVKKLFGADLKVTLTRFEQLFSDLNALLPETRSAS